MGLFDKLSEHPCGFVSGGLYNGLYVKTIKKDGELKICFYQHGIVIGKKKEPLIFTKKDTKKITILQSGVAFTEPGMRINPTRYIGNRYQIEFNNGSIAIISCPLDNSQWLEKVLL